MKRTTAIVMTIFLVLSSCSTREVTGYHIQDNNNQTGDTTNPPDAQYNILFVGNSLTYSNNLPNLVKAEAADNGIVIGTHMLAYSNYAIVDHWADGDVQELIASGDYDFVVIQQGPSSQQNGYDMLVNAGADYANLCQAHNVKLAYFMVWPSIQYYHTFSGVITNYTAGANANNAILCPVGRVWKDYIDQTNNYSYYGPDGFHPSLEGSRVAAEVIFEYLNL